jgi:hypothetical protein
MVPSNRDSGDNVYNRLMNNVKRRGVINKQMYRSQIERTRNSAKFERSGNITVNAFKPQSVKGSKLSKVINYIKKSDSHNLINSKHKPIVISLVYLH